MNCHVANHARHRNSSFCLFNKQKWLIDRLAQLSHPRSPTQLPRVDSSLRDGQLVRVLPEYEQEADISAVYPLRLSESATVRVCVEFLQERLTAAIKRSRSLNLLSEKRYGTGYIS